MDAIYPMSECEGMDDMQIALVIWAEHRISENMKIPSDQPGVQFLAKLALENDMGIWVGKFQTDNPELMND
jgi:hypothetical protein